MAIPRRTVLRGMGAMLALPLLDSMVPALSALQKTAGKPVNRFGVFYVPNGMIMKNYLPTAVGANFELTPTLSALAPFRENMLVAERAQQPADARAPGGAHAKASTRFLTDVSPPTSETWLDAGISMDQILANETGKQTQLASLELAMESGENCRRLRCRLRLPLHQHDRLEERQHAAADAEQPARRVRAAVRRRRDDRSESAAGAHAPAAQRARFGDARKSRSCRARCRQSDRAKLTEYLVGVRDVERRIQLAEAQSDQRAAGRGSPGGHSRRLGRAHAS